MLMSSKFSRQFEPVLGRSRLSDIAPVFNLIQTGSRHGHFSNLYTQPRYMAGLGIQLFSMWSGGRIRLPDGRWHPVRMKVLRVGGDFAGFVILRRDACSPHELEIYMCGVGEEFKGRGLGEWMLRTAVSEVPGGCVVYADCLPGSIQMKSLLRKLAFSETGVPVSTPILHAAQRFAYSKHSDKSGSS